MVIACRACAEIVNAESLRDFFARISFFIVKSPRLLYSPRGTFKHSEASMLKGAIVGAVALTMGMTSLAAAETWGAPGKHQDRVASHSGPAIKEAHIARLRTVLNLTAEQQRYWGPVESALRGLARQQAREEASVGLVQRMSDKATTMASTAVQLRRLHRWRRH